MRTTLPPLPWQLGHVPRREFDSPDVYDLDAVQDWLSARVPGNVRLDLLVYGMIPDPFWEDQYRKSDWVDEADWWYRVSIEPEWEAGQRIFVRFHGIDYRFAIFVNGKEAVRREGMFSRQTIEITEAAQNGPVDLAVRIWGSEALPQRRLSSGQNLWQALAQLLPEGKNGVYPDRSATLKAQYSFGWDFAPRILTVGIWDEVELITTGAAFIEDCQINVSPDGEGDVLLTLNASGDEEIPVTYTVSPHNFEGEGVSGQVSKGAGERVSGGADERRDDALPSGQQSAVSGQSGGHSPFTIHHLPFTIPNPKLWQPWDRGFPHLYTLQIDIPGDSLTLQFGIRSVELADWQFKINGQNEFIRGLNWVPADSFPARVTTNDYRELLRMAKDTGANMLRVWGGGLREKQDFYNLCDEMGLLVWQEFPFACMFLGTYPDDEPFLSLVEQETAEIVRQLDNHPSVVAWCGGNEFSPNRNRPLMQAMTRALQNVEHAPRPFIPASPGPGDAHNWLVWHGKAPLSAYREEEARFLSEFGLQALPDSATMEAILLHPESNWKLHNGERSKLNRYFKLFLNEAETASDNLAALIKASQQAQAVGLQIAIEHIRRRKGDSGGVILWQFNEPWPAISWAIVDYFRRPKLAYRLLKQWYSPLLLSLDFEAGMNWQPGNRFEAEVWGVNDSLDAVRGACYASLDRERIFEAEDVTLPPNSSLQLGKIAYRLKKKPQELTVVFWDKEQMIAQNSYDLSWHDETKINLWQRFRRWMAEKALQ